MDQPLPTQSTANRFGVVVPSMISIANYNGRNPANSADVPITTVTANPKGGHHALVSAFLQRQFGRSVGGAVSDPAGTVTAGGGGKSVLTTSNLIKLRGTCRAGQAATEPMPTLTSGGNHVGEVRVFLLKYYGTDQDPRLREPLHTLTTKDRFGLVTVNIEGEPYVITDIGMRMLSPRELFRAQGFPDTYQINFDIDGKKITKSDQVRMCGNSVCPPIAAALVDANVNISKSVEAKRAADGL